MNHTIKNGAIVLLAVFGFAGVVFALPYYQQTQGLVPGQNDAYYIGTSTPSLLEYKGIFTKDITISGTCTGCGGGSSGNVSTSSSETAGQIAYWTTNSATPAKLGKVASTTLTITGPFNVPVTQGFLVGGSNSSITYWGLATTSQPASSNLLVSNGVAGVYGVATSTLTATTPLTGSLTVLGSGGSLGCQNASVSQTGCITASDFAAHNAKVGTSSAETANQIPFWTTTSGTPPLLSGGVSNFAFSASDGTNRFSVPSNGWFGIAGTADTNLFVYASSTNQVTILGLLAGGNNATTSATVTRNTFIGYKAATGGGAGGSITDTTAVGATALLGVTTGSANTVVGSQALDVLTTGNNNTAIGYRAGHELTTNSGSNVFVGQQSTAASGSYNTFFGSQTGISQGISGSYNVLLGPLLTVPTASGSNQLNIGNIIYGTNMFHGATVTASPVTNGNIGIGSTSPFAQFSIHAVNGSTNLTLFTVASSTASATTTLFNILNNGNVGVGTSSPGSLLSLGGSGWNFYDNATSTKNGIGGVNIVQGCYAINGVCPTQTSGTVTSVTLATPNATLSLGGTNPITTSGTINADLNLGHSNFWTALQNFTNASTSQLTATSSVYLATSAGSVGVGTTTPGATLSVFIGGDYTSRTTSTAFLVGSSTAGLATTTLFGIDSRGNITTLLSNALVLSGGAGSTLSAFAGTSCTNQFVRSLSGTGSATCASVANTDLSNSSVTINTAYPLAGGGALSLGGTLSLTFSGLSTTSPWTNGQLAYVNGPSSVTSVATSTETCATPLSCTAHIVLTGGGAISISQANATTNGYLGSTDFATFNMKVGTSSSETAGQVAAWGTTSGSPPKLYSVATSTPVIGSVITYSGTLGNFVGGVGGTFGIANSVVTNAMLANSSVSFTSTDSSLTVPASIALGASGAFMLNLGHSNFWTALQNFTNATTSQLTATSSTYLATTVGKVGIGTTSPAQLLSAGNLDASGGLYYSASGLSVGSSTPGFPFSVVPITSNITANFYISAAGTVVGYDATNAWNGRITPTKSAVLQTGTTTTWTGTTSAPYIPEAVAPFAGSIKAIRCHTDQSFLGVEIDINGTAIAPSYFVASTTVGKILATGSNTFSAGDRISAKVGTTSTAATLSVSCAVDTVETP